MKSLNPACKLIGLVVPTLLLAGLHHPAVNLAVFAVCLAALLLSRANVKVLAGALLPVLLVAVGMFSTGYHFHAGAGMPINAAAQALTGAAVWNGLVQYLGHREWQMDDFCREKGEAQPELSRTEYLRLLSSAKHMGKEKPYLLIKTLGGAGVRIQELPQLTVDVVKRGMVELEYHNARQKRVLYLPEGLRRELWDYVEREGLREGPVFQSAEGTPMARSSINYCIAMVSREAHVGEGKANPRCLWKMYQNTCLGIRSNISVLVEQAYQRMVEEEQLAVGWDV